MLRTRAVVIRNSWPARPRTLRRLRGCLLAGALLCAALPAAAPAASAEPAAGQVLVAARSTGGVFSQSIVYLLEHGVQGTLGLIVNRQTEVSLKEVVPRLGELDRQGHKLGYGGPVGLNALKFLVHSSADPGDAIKVESEVFASGSPELLERLLREELDAEHLRVFIGYAGWAPGQLDGELRRGVWYVDHLPAAQVFEAGPGAWENLIDRLDPPGIQARI